MLQTTFIQLVLVAAILWRLLEVNRLDSKFTDPTSQEFWKEKQIGQPRIHSSEEITLETKGDEPKASERSRKKRNRDFQSPNSPLNNEANQQHQPTTTKQEKTKTNGTDYDENDSTVDSRHGREPSQSEVAAENTPGEEIRSPSSSISSSSLSLIRNSCFGFNSDEWVFGNISSNEHDGITPALLDTLLEGSKHFRKLPSLFDQTICHDHSPLRNFIPRITSDLDSANFLASVEDWYQRFFYLALHWRFHRPALEEYRSRKTCAEKDTRDGTRYLQSFMDHHGIGKMDFECKDAKFVIIPIGSIGFGAFLNTQASLCILLALRTGRIPIFSSRSYFYWQKRKGDQDPWLLAPLNCSRKDMQCYFLPTSPCTVTIEDLKNAPTYGSTRQEQRFLRKNVTIPPELEAERVVVLNPGLSGIPKYIPGIGGVVHKVVTELLSEWKMTENEGEDSLLTEEWEAIDLAHQWILEKAKADPNALLRQVYVYMLRPNPYYKDLLNRQMSRIGTKNINPSETIGLAIRGSDKCISESTCLPFDRYMELATNIVYPTLLSSDNANSFTAGENRPKLIMTTEDPKVFNQSLAYQHNMSFPFQFVVNENDNMQGTGYPREFALGEAEKTILSSLIALQFQFNAGKVFLNCCSNFHVVLNNLIRGQCGARRHGHDFVFSTNTSDDSTPFPPPVAQCLNEDGIPERYRICCNWSKKSSTCKKLWSEYLEEKDNYGFQK
eukprot:jgi/Psemu1/292734/fgenesh1_pg.1265_\